MVRRQVICIYKSQYCLIYTDTVPLTRNYERTVVCYENNSEKSTILSRIFYNKNLFRNQKSTLTVHIRATP